MFKAVYLWEVANPESDCIETSFAEKCLSPPVGPIRGNSFKSIGHFRAFAHRNVTQWPLSLPKPTPSRFPYRVRQYGPFRRDSLLDLLEFSLVSHIRRCRSLSNKSEVASFPLAWYSLSFWSDDVAALGSSFAGLACRDGAALELKTKKEAHQFNGWVSALSMVKFTSIPRWVMRWSYHFLESSRSSIRSTKPF